MVCSNVQKVVYCLYVVDPWDNVSRTYLLRNKHQLPAISWVDRNKGEPYTNNKETNPTGQYDLDPVATPPLWPNTDQNAVQQSKLEEVRVDMNYLLKPFLNIPEPEKKKSGG